MVKDFLVVRTTADMKMIIGCIRNCEIDASVFLRRLASRCDWKLSDLSIIADAEPRGGPFVDMAKARRELEYFKAAQAEDSEEADPVSVVRQLVLQGEQFADAVSSTIRAQYEGPLGTNGDDEDDANHHQLNEGRP